MERQLKKMVTVSGNSSGDGGGGGGGDSVATQVKPVKHILGERETKSYLTIDETEMNTTSDRQKK